jgi:hypothetical protein
MYLARIFERMVAAQFGRQQDNPREKTLEAIRVYIHQ